MAKVAAAGAFCSLALVLALLRGEERRKVAFAAVSAVHADLPLRGRTQGPAPGAFAPHPATREVGGASRCPSGLVLASAVAACALGARRGAEARRGARRVQKAASAAEDGGAAAAKQSDEADLESYREMLRSGKTAAPSATATKKAEKGWLDDPEKREDLKTFVTSVSVALLFRFTIAEPRFIPSESMVPAFEVGDQLVVDKISKNWRDYQRRDVVVFDPPPLYWQVVQRDPDGSALIKRIVAIEGDFVEMQEGGDLYVNDEKQDEPFTNEKAAYTFSRRQVPPGAVLVLGDNRNRSLDGHVWSYLPVKNIIGRATFNWWPPWHVHTIAAAPP